MNKQKLTNAFIIDDNQEAIELLQRMLENNYSVQVVGTAHDAETAANAIIKTDPDLLFLDVELPTMSGLDFCCLIRNERNPRPRSCSTPPTTNTCSMPFVARPLTTC